jgi:hypothetical protein
MQTSLCIAATIHVPFDQPTIQAGIDAAVDGDTVLVAPGTYTGNGNRDIDFKGKAVVVATESGPELTIVDCQAGPDTRHRGFNFVSSEDSLSELVGFTIRGGFGPSMVWFQSGEMESMGGAIAISGSSPTISNCSFVGNAAVRGGAVAVVLNSSPRFVNCNFAGNVIQTRAGAIYAIQSQLVCSNCSFIRNGYGHGLGAFYTELSTSYFDRCIFRENNGSEGSGCGGVASGSIQLKRCTFVSNQGGEQDVDALYTNNASASLLNCIIAFNRGKRHFMGNVTLECCDVYGNGGGDWVGDIADQANVNGNFSADPLFCDTTSGNLDLHSNSSCLATNNTCGVQIGAMSVGCSSASADDPADELPVSCRLSQNYPNPFNPSTTIEFELPKPGRVTLVIYNSLGQAVRKLVDRVVSASVHKVVWDSKDEMGNEVASGVYLYRLTAGDVVQEKKMVLVR